MYVLAYIKFHIEFVLEQIVHVPTFAKPLGAFFVGFQTEPISARFLIVLDILKGKPN